MGKDKSERKKKIKKFFNTLWLVGSILCVFLVVVSVGVLWHDSYRKVQQEKVLASLAKYNKMTFGYEPKQMDIVKVYEKKAPVTENVNELLQTIDAENIRILDTYDILSVEIKEPKDDLETVVNNIKDSISLWKIIKNGVVYWGTPEDTTIQEKDIVLVEKDCLTVDDFMDELDNTIYNVNSMIKFYDEDIGSVILTRELSEHLITVIENEEPADKILLELKLIDEIGQHTRTMDYLYELSESIL